jgi:hypothetical protein
MAEADKEEPLCSFPPTQLLEKNNLPSRNASINYSDE